MVDETLLLRREIAGLLQKVIDLKASVAELEAANKTLRDEIAQYWEPLVLGLTTVHAKAD